MGKTKIPNIHPGEILLEEFMKPLELSQYKTRFDLENEKDKSLHRIESEIHPFNKKAA